MSPEYRFEHRWSLPLPAEEVYDVLADVEAYPTWWRQVRAVARLDDESVHVVARSWLPYSLDLVLTRGVEDRDAGVLEARLSGRLDGWARWSLARVTAASTSVHYVQHVAVRGVLLRAGSRLARPVLVANHTAMMRGAREGLLRRGRGPAGSSAR